MQNFIKIQNQKNKIRNLLENLNIEKNYKQELRKKHQKKPSKPVDIKSSDEN